MSPKTPILILVPPDRFPSWRKVAWSEFSDVIAVGNSSGTIDIYDLNLSQIYTIYPVSLSSLFVGHACKSVCFVFFTLNTDDP